MSRNSARPDVLEHFPTAVEPVADALRTLRNRGEDVVSAFVSGAGEVPVSVDPGQLGYLDDARAEVVHLAGWVADVGRGFREAGGDVDGDGIFDAEDTPLSKLVGEPTILEAEAAAQGQAGARELQAALREMGIDPEHFDPKDLQFLDPGSDEYRALFELIESQGDQMGSEDYAAGYFDVLGPEGMRATLGLIDSFASTKGNTGLAGPDTDWMGDIGERLLVPFANGWSHATNSIDLEEEMEAMLHPDGDRWWEQRQLALLMAGNGSNYDPTWLADAADQVLVAGADDDVALFEDPMGYPGGADYESDAWYPGLGGNQYLYDDHTLGYPGLIALGALGDNTEAANLFALRGSDQRDVLVHPDDHVWLSPVTRDAEDMQAELHVRAGDVLEQAFLQAPYGVRDSDAPGGRRMIIPDWEAQLDAYDDLLRLVGEGDVPDPVKESAARTLLPYLPDISVVASEGYLEPGGQDGQFSRPDLVDFFEELGYHEPATAIVGEQLGAWGEAGFVGLPPGDLNSSDAIKTHLRRVTLLTDVAADGLFENADARDQAAKDFWGGIARGTSFALSAGAAAVPLIIGGPVGIPAAAAIAGASGVVNFGLGTVAADPPVDVPEIDADDIERDLTTKWRDDLIDHLVAEGVIDGDLSPDDRANALERLTGNRDVFTEIQQSVGQHNYGGDDHW